MAKHSATRRAPAAAQETADEHPLRGRFAVSRSVGPGFDAPICQDTCSGGLGAVLAHAEVCHNALVEFTSKEAFEASNDLALGPAIGGAACDVVDRSAGGTASGRWRLDRGRRWPVRLEFPILSLHPGLRPRCVAPDVWLTLSRA